MSIYPSWTRHMPAVYTQFINRVKAERSGQSVRQRNLRPPMLPPPLPLSNIHLLPSTPSSLNKVVPSSFRFFCVPISRDPWKKILGVPLWLFKFILAGPRLVLSLLSLWKNGRNGTYIRPCPPHCCVRAWGYPTIFDSRKGSSDQ